MKLNERHLFLVGSRKATETKFARFCAWGSHWMSPVDHVRHLFGRPTTHSMCSECAKKWEDEGRQPTPPRPAA